MNNLHREAIAYNRAQRGLRRLTIACAALAFIAFSGSLGAAMVELERVGSPTGQGDYSFAAATLCFAFAFAVVAFGLSTTPRR